MFLSALHEMKKHQRTFEPAGLGCQGRSKPVRKVPRWMKLAGILLVVCVVAMWIKPNARLGALFFALAVPACFFAGFVLVRQCCWRLASDRWPVVRGTIAGVRVGRDKSPGQPKHADGSFRHELWEAEVVYTYEVGERRFRAKEVLCPATGFSMQYDSREEAHAAVSAYRVGASVRVRHHPVRPGICLLESQPRKKWKLELAMSIFFFAMGAVWATVTWAIWTGRGH